MAQSGFNPKARWDRFIPEDTDSGQDSLLSQRIDVLAWFKNAKVYPRSFFWNGKEYKIQKITYSWQERLGRETLIYFSVDAGCGLYQISFNNTTLGWRLDKVIE